MMSKNILSFISMITKVSILWQTYFLLQCLWSFKWHLQIFQIWQPYLFFQICDHLHIACLADICWWCYNATIVFFRSRWFKKGQHDLFSHVAPLVPALASHDTGSIINGTLHLWGKDKNELCNHWHSCWCHVMVMMKAMSMEP